MKCRSITAWNSLLDEWAWKPGVQARIRFHAFFMTENKNIHIGQLVKSVFDDRHLSVSELARQLHCDRSNVYSIFQRRSIDIELLAKLSKVLNYNFLEEAMKLYGLHSVTSARLNLNISIADIETEEMRRLTELLVRLKRE